MTQKMILSSLIIGGLLMILAVMLVVAAESPAGRVEFFVPNMTCGACSKTIAAGLEKAPGVSKVEVDVAAKTVQVNYDEKKTDAGEIALQLNKLGYPGRIVALNGKVAAVGGEVVAKKSGGCGGNCCDRSK